MNILKQLSGKTFLYVVKDENNSILYIPTIKNVSSSKCSKVEYDDLGKDKLN